MEQATDQITSRLDMGKDYVAETVTGLAQAIRKTGQQLREEGSQPTMAQYADRGAAQVERFGGYLRQRDTGQLVSDLEGFARRQPMAFAGSAFALGMLAVRFLRSESQPQRQMGSSAPYGRPALSTPPTTPRPMTGTVPGSPLASPGGNTGAGQSTVNRPGSSQPTMPAGSTPATVRTPGVPTTPAPGTATPGARPPQTPPGAGSSPSAGAAVPGAGTTAPRPESGSQRPSVPPPPQRPGTPDQNRP